VGFSNFGGHLIEVAREARAVIEVSLGEEEGRLGDGEGISELVRDARADGACGGEAGRAALDFSGVSVSHAGSVA
jgi:hypothetical protein